MSLSAPSLTRHAVCLGMTGSGKTGLCVGLLEDLAGQGVPLIALDPKGDLTNLALVFPDLAPASFAPWVDPGEAVRHGLSVDALAARTAEVWRAGLAKAGVGPAELAAWKDRVEVVVMTPGSTAGVPVDVLGALTRCPPGLDPEGRTAYVTGAVSALLGLVERPSDPLNDPEAILLAKLLGDAFADGRDLPLDALLGQVIDPPFDRLGYFPIDEVLPPKARQALALSLNNVVASPAFASWRTGLPLDLDAWTAPVHGRTPIRVLYLAHLSDPERMFFVALLLHAVVAWTRRLPGTGHLRALVYMDEVFGFLPPHPKDPPSKTPLLTLLKQARGVGVGVMLATQNPVDVDYKALSNAGTWLIGRLQTENDRERVIEGMLTGTAGDRADLDRRLGALPPRTFLVRDAHGAISELRSRHTYAYLRGPLTRLELDRVGEPAPDVAPPPPPPAAEAALSGPPPVPAGMASVWVEGEGGVTFEPHLLVRVALRYPADLREPERIVERVVALVPDAPVLADVPAALTSTAAPGRYPLLPTWADQPAELDAVVQRVVQAVRGEEVAVRWRCAAFDLTSDPGETAEAFSVRVFDLASREQAVVREVHTVGERGAKVVGVRVLWRGR